MQFQKMSDALLYAVKIYKIIIPFILIMFTISGILMIYLLPMVYYVGLLMIGVGILLALIIFVIMQCVKRKIIKLQEKGE